MSTEELVPTILNAYEPSMAALEDGGHLAVWSSADADRRGIWAQRYDDDGVAVGPIYRINTDETGGQERPEIIRLDDNSLVVVWTDRDTTTLDFEGHTAQRLTPTGALDGGPFQVDTNVAANLGGVDPGTQLSALADNPNDPADVSRFVSVWETYNQDGSLNGIFGQVFNANGKVGTEFQVNTYTTGAQYRAEVKGLADGGFVVLWQSNAGVWGADKSAGIFGQRFDAAGAPVGVEFHVNSTTEDAQEYPQIVAMDDGGFLAVWASGANKTSKSPEDGYYLQRYAADGTTVGEETWIDVELTQIFGASGQLRPALVKAIELQDGGFALLWENREVGTAHVQSFTADGAALTPAQEVITNNNSHLYAPDLDQLNDGRLIVTHGHISGATGDNGIFRTYLDAPPASEFGFMGVISGASDNDIIDGT